MGCSGRSAARGGRAEPASGGANKGRRGTSRRPGRGAEAAEIPLKTACSGSMAAVANRAERLVAAKPDEHFSRRAIVPGKVRNRLDRRRLGPRRLGTIENVAPIVGRIGGSGRGERRHAVEKIGLEAAFEPRRNRRAQAVEADRVIGSF